MLKMNIYESGWYGGLGVPVHVTTSKYLRFSVFSDRLIEDAAKRFNKWLFMYYLKMETRIHTEIEEYLLCRFPNNLMKHPFGKMWCTGHRLVCRICVWERGGEIYDLSYIVDGNVYKTYEQVIKEMKEFIDSNITATSK